MSPKLTPALFMLALLSPYAKAAQLKLVSAPMAMEYAQSLSAGHDVKNVNKEQQFEAFCTAIGQDEVDILFSSRKINTQDLEICAQNGITKIVELPLAHNALLLQTSSEKANFSLNKEDLYKAFSAYIWDEHKGIKGNDTHNWSDINESFGEIPIHMIQKIWDSEDFEELYRDYIFGSCQQPSYEELEKTALIYADSLLATRLYPFSDILYGEQSLEIYKKGQNFAQDNYCKHFRADRYKIVNENAFDQLKMAAYPKENQIFISSYVEQDPDFYILRLEGQIPSADTIKQGLYPLSYSLYAYVKMAHIGAKKGLKTYVDQNLMESPEKLINKAIEQKYIMPKVSEIKQSIEAYKNYEHYIEFSEN